MIATKDIDPVLWLPLVYRVARKLEHAVYPHLEFEEAVSAGTIGLMNAIQSYDPSTGFTFVTHAHPRIHGAIMDELRTVRPWGRLLYKRSAKYQRAVEFLAARLHRDPTREEMLTFLGQTSKVIEKLRRDVEAKHITNDALPLDRLAAGGISLEDAATQDWVRWALHVLTEKERHVITRYYWADEYQTEIAAAMGVTESRVSQIRKAALGKLRRLLHENNAL